MYSFKILLIVGILFAVQAANTVPSEVNQQKSPSLMDSYINIGHEVPAEKHEGIEIKAPAAAGAKRNIEAKSPGPSTWSINSPPTGGFLQEERKIEAEAKSPGGPFYTPGGFPHEAEGRHETVEANAPVVQGRSEKPGFITPGGVPLVPAHPHERSETPGYGEGLFAPGSPNGPGQPGIRTVEDPKVQAPAGCPIWDWRC